MFALVEVLLNYRKLKNMEAPLIDIPELWRGLDPEQVTGTVMVVGASDTGKSTLVRWLIGRLCQHHRRVGWLDGDVGQSTLGLPTTLSLAVVDQAPVLLPRPQASYFVGATSPRGHMLPLLVGLQRLQHISQAKGAEALVVDTTGLVARETGGEALKRWKAELLQPRLILALQRRGELEPLLAPWRLDSRFELLELTLASSIRRRSAEERIGRRRLLFRHYFENAGTLFFSPGQVAVYGAVWATPGRILGLLDKQGLALGIGVLQQWTEEGLEVHTPVRMSPAVNALAFGTFGIDPLTGLENHELPPVCRNPQGLGNSS